MKIGFICSIGFAIMAFNFTVKKPLKIEDDKGTVNMYKEEVKIVRTKQEKPKPPPVLELKEKFEVVEEVELEIPEAPKKFSLSIDDPDPDIDFGEDDGYDDDPIIEPEVEEPIDILVEEPVLDFAEYMPSFGDCDAYEMSKEEYKACSDAALLSYFAKRINYPARARENDIEGRVILKFVVNEKGEIQNPKVLKGVAGGCSEEALRVLESMPLWKPGRHGGKNVKVHFTLPVSFKLR